LQEYNLTQLTFLVLERHLLIRNLLTQVFQEFGVATELSTPDTEIAYDMFMTNDVDIVLSDWTPEFDGLAFLKRLRQDKTSHNPFVPVIICTAHTEMSHVAAARDMGMTEFLAKPVSAKTIYLRICAVIENHRSFIRAGNFFGPDRRREYRNLGSPYTGVERRLSLRIMR